jgi:rod shape-determining protein MreD
MKKYAVQLTVLFFTLALLQVCIFNHIHLFGYATPVVGSYFLCKLPVRLNRNLTLLLAALLGIVMDIFGYTLGLNMLSMVVAGFMRFWLLKLFMPKDMIDNGIPSFETFGRTLFMRYAVSMALLHTAVLFVIEAGSLLNIQTAFRIACSLILTVLLIYAFENIYSEKIKV